MKRGISGVVVGIVAMTLGSLARGADNLLSGAVQPGTIHIQLDPVASGFAAPVLATSVPGSPSDLLIVDQVGKIVVLHNGVVQPTAFLDLTALEAAIPLNGPYDERGLLGLAFDPDYLNPGTPGYQTLYTYHSEAAGTATADFAPAVGTVTTSINHQNVLTAWKISAGNPLVVDTSTRIDLLREDHPALNHNGGTIAFGPDGNLYLAIGDGGAANDAGNGHIDSTGNAQALEVIMGKMIRIDPHGNNSANGKYGIPADNPFISTPSALPEIYAYGLRNPFRFSFDSATGTLVLGDVGQNNVEEIDVITSGGNYGWAVKEGTFLFNRTGPSSGTVGANSPGVPAGMIDPLLEYDHNAGIAVLGGFVYHGSMLPELEGKYVFGDLGNGASNGRLFYADLYSGQIYEFNMDVPLGMWLKGFGEDADGEIYALASANIGLSGTTGVVLKLVPEPGSLALLGLAMAPMLLRRWRRQSFGGE